MGGWRTIARILGGPTPVRTAVIHADDDPPSMRKWLAANGWRIDAEVLADAATRPRPRARLAEIILARPGVEATSGFELHYGPRLLASADSRLEAHLTHARLRWERIAIRSGGRRPDALLHISFLLAREQLCKTR